MLFYFWLLLNWYKWIFGTGWILVLWRLNLNILLFFDFFLILFHCFIESDGGLYWCLCLFCDFFIRVICVLGAFWLCFDLFFHLWCSWLDLSGGLLFWSFRDLVCLLKRLFGKFLGLRWLVGSYVISYLSSWLRLIFNERVYLSCRLFFRWWTLLLLFKARCKVRWRSLFLQLLMVIFYFFSRFLINFILLSGILKLSTGC